MTELVISKKQTFYNRERRHWREADAVFTAEVEIFIKKTYNKNYLICFMCMIFQTRPFWSCIRVSNKKLRNRSEELLSELNIDNPNIIDTFVENKDIMRNIIDSCNIWIENGILYQHNIDTMSEAKYREFSMDIDLMLDLYLYGVLPNKEFHF